MQHLTYGYNTQVPKSTYRHDPFQYGVGAVSSWTNNRVPSKQLVYRQPCLDSLTIATSSPQQKDVTLLAEYSTRIEFTKHKSTVHLPSR